MTKQAHRELDRETAQLEQENEDLVAQVDDLLAGDGCKVRGGIRQPAQRCDPHGCVYRFLCFVLLGGGQEGRI